MNHTRPGIGSVSDISSRNYLLSSASLALSMTLVGSYVALSKPLLTALPVFLLAWLRFGVGGLAMLHWLKKPSDEPPLTATIHVLLFLEALFGNFLFSICMLYGMRISSAVSAGIVMAATPAAVALLGHILLRERLGVRLQLAVLCAVAGIALTALGQPGTSASSGIGDRAGVDAPWLGTLLILAAVFCEATYAVIGRKLTHTLGARRISALVNLWGFALMTPLGLPLFLNFDFSALSLQAWLLLLYYALAASVWSVWLWMNGLIHIPATHSGVFTVFLPISAALTGTWLLGEPVASYHFMAFGIALAGVLLATLQHRDEPTRSGTD